MGMVLLCVQLLLFYSHTRIFWSLAWAVTVPLFSLGWTSNATMRQKHTSTWMKTLRYGCIKYPLHQPLFVTGVLITLHSTFILFIAISFAIVEQLYKWSTRAWGDMRSMGSHCALQGKAQNIQIQMNEKSTPLPVREMYNWGCPMT